MLMWLRRRVYFLFQHIASNLSGSCDRTESGTREWIIILRMRHSILSNTKRPFWSRWRMKNMPNIDVCRLMYLKANRDAISSPPQQLHNPVNHPVIYMIGPALMKNTWHLTMCLKWHLDKPIAQHTYWPPQGSIWIHRMKIQRTGGKLIQTSMITTATQWRLAVHFGFRT